jgi:hypothetical protein
MTDRDDARVAKALQGADFPADQETLVQYAETRGADPKTLQALQTVPKRRYGSVSEVVDAVPQEPEGRDRPGGTAR